MELIDRIREILKRDYGINSDEELLQAVREQTPVDIGIFVSACGREKRHEAMG